MAHSREHSDRRISSRAAWRTETSGEGIRYNGVIPGTIIAPGVRADILYTGTRVKKLPYRFLPHTADARVEVRAPTLGQLLAECAAVVRDLAAGDSPVEPQERRDVVVTADRPEELVVSFVRHLLHGFAVDAFIPAGFLPSHVDARSARGVIPGERFDRGRHAPQPEVKALTRHGLSVRETPDGWVADLLFDL